MKLFFASIPGAVLVAWFAWNAYQLGRKEVAAVFLQVLYVIAIAAAFGWAAWSAAYLLCTFVEWPCKSM